MILRKEARIWRRLPGLPCADASLALSLPQRLISSPPQRTKMSFLDAPVSLFSVPVVWILAQIPHVQKVRMFATKLYELRYRILADLNAS